MTISQTIQSSSTPARALLARRFAGQPAWAAVTELFIGLGWLRAAVSKIIDLSWWTGEYLIEVLDAHAELTLGWFRPLVETTIVPAAPLVALAVLVGQLVAAASLLCGRRRALGLSVGMILNSSFVAAGIVNPSAFYLVAQGTLALWLVDHWSQRRRSQMLSVAAVVAVFVAGFNVPFVGTLDPSLVIEDPAAMFVTIGMLTVVGAFVGAGAWALGGGAPERSDGRHPKANSRPAGRRLIGDD